MKKAYITVLDRHFTGDDSEPECGELRTDCTISTKDGAIIVKYNETVEKSNDCETQLIIQNNRITMMRIGRFRTSMIFECQKRHICCYETPIGEMMIGIYTNAMFTDFDEEGGILNFAYSIDSGGDLISENELKIFVEVKEDKDVCFSETSCK